MIHVTTEIIDIIDHKNLMIPISCDGKLYGISKYLLNSRSKIKNHLKILAKNKILKIDNYYQFQYTKKINFYFLPIKQSYTSKPRELGITNAINNIIKIIDNYGLDEIHMPFIGADIGNSDGDFLENYYYHINMLKNIQCKIYIHLPVYSVDSYMIVV